MNMLASQHPSPQGLSVTENPLSGEVFLRAVRPTGRLEVTGVHNFFGHKTIDITDSNGVTVSDLPAENFIVIG